MLNENVQPAAEYAAHENNIEYQIFVKQTLLSIYAARLIWIQGIKKCEIQKIAKIIERTICERLQN